MKYLVASVLVAASSVAAARPAPLVSIPSHDGFFDNIAAHCGKAYEGKVSVDNATGPSSFAGKKLVMHVRRCNEREYNGAKRILMIMEKCFCGMIEDYH